MSIDNDNGFKKAQRDYDNQLPDDDHNYSDPCETCNIIFDCENNCPYDIEEENNNE